MLKFLFWALVAANAGVLAYGQGYLGQPAGSEREPARVTRQLDPDKLVQLSAVDAKAAVDVAEAEAAAAAPVAAAPAPVPAPPPVPAPAPAPASAPAAPSLVACVQTGPFNTSDARRFESRIAALNLGARETRIDVPFQDITSHLVYLPPAGGREGAQKRIADLKEHGVENFFIMQGDTPLRYAVSLGVFKTDGAAQKLVAELQKKGVRGVRVLPRGPQGTRPAYQYRGIEPAVRQRLAGIADNFSGGELRDCD